MYNEINFRLPNTPEVCRCITLENSKIKFARKTRFKCDFLLSIQQMSAKYHENKRKD